LNGRKKSFYEIPLNNSKFFETRKFNVEHFGLSLTQRFTAFFACFILGILSFVYAITNIVYYITNPSKFAFPYAFSNLMFFIMFGFIKGFKTYMIDLFKPSKRPYSISFIVTTSVTLYFSSSVNYIFKLMLLIIQIVSCISFGITFIPGGAFGLSSIMSMILSR